MTVFRIRQPSPVASAFDRALADLLGQGASVLDISIELGRSPCDILLMLDAWGYARDCAVSMLDRSDPLEAVA